MIAKSNTGLDTNKGGGKIFLAPNAAYSNGNSFRHEC